jgi:hypothetical protein
MMMRYLGLGVGHMQPPEFPREDSALQVTRERDYIPPSKRQASESQPASHHDVTVATTTDRPDEEADGSEGEEGDSEEDEEDEEIRLEQFGSDESDDEGYDNPVLFEY